VDHTFDRTYWDRVWSAEEHGRPGGMGDAPPNPHLLAQASALAPGTALDAGCGAGAEALWLAAAGWDVTAVDIAEEALARGSSRAADARLGDRVTWVRADLSTWDPPHPYDLVATHYAHPTIPQLDFYRRIARWVSPGGTLLVVGHLHRGAGVHRAPHPPTGASVTASAVSGLLPSPEWVVETAEEVEREVVRPGGRPATVHDVVVRATRTR
jgi:SAM-dependent methyltransferase